MIKYQNLSVWINYKIKYQNSKLPTCLSTGSAKAGLKFKDLQIWNLFGFCFLRFVFSRLPGLGFITLLLIGTNLIAGNGESPLTLKVGDNEPVNLSRFFETVMPGKTISFFVASENIESVIVKSDFGKIVSKGNGKWKYISPVTSGNYEIVIEDTTNNQAIIFTVFVLVPLSKKKGEYLNGYRIGNYPDENYKDRKNYKKPDGLIEVTEKNKAIYITPHFQLKQFLCKQASGWPKYLLVNPKLLLKLEYLVSELNGLGINASTIFIMSGYRTPFYNKAIGNVKFSRHVFGDAADIYVDENLDGVNDDLDKNGKSEMDDVLILHSIISKFDNNPENEHLVGGMGKYNKNSAHTYFIHIDTRGYKARW